MRQASRIFFRFENQNVKMCFKHVPHPRCIDNIVHLDLCDSRPKWPTFEVHRDYTPSHQRRLPLPPDRIKWGSSVILQQTQLRIARVRGRVV